MATCDLLSVAVYAPDGAFLQEFGRRGEGPGDFPSQIELLRVQNDELHIYTGTRVSRFALPDLKFTGTGRALGRGTLYDVLSIDAHNVEVRDIPSPEAAGLPFFVVNQQGQTIANFGGTAPSYEIDAPMLSDRHLSTASSPQEFWAAHRGRYQLELWSITGELRRTLVRQLTWFPPVSRAVRIPDALRESAQIQDLKLGPDGRLWALITAGREQARAQGGQLVEVISPQGGLYASGVVPAYLVQWIGKELAYGFAGRTSDGTPFIAVYRVTLVDGARP